MIPEITLFRNKDDRWQVCDGKSTYFCTFFDNFPEEGLVTFEDAELVSFIRMATKRGYRITILEES